MSDLIERLNGVASRVQTDADEKTIDEAAAELERLTAENAALRAALLAAKRNHYKCDDCWFSCPKSGECCNEAEGDECNCGADKHNAAIDAAMTKEPTNA